MLTLGFWWAFVGKCDQLNILRSNDAATVSSQLHIENAAASEIRH